jgi:hypothetical protein
VKPTPLRKHLLGAVMDDEIYHAERGQFSQNYEHVPDILSTTAKQCLRDMIDEGLLVANLPAGWAVQATTEGKIQWATWRA